LVTTPTPISEFLARHGENPWSGKATRRSRDLLGGERARCIFCHRNRFQCSAFGLDFRTFGHQTADFWALHALVTSKQSSFAANASNGSGQRNIELHRCVKRCLHCAVNLSGSVNKRVKPTNQNISIIIGSINDNEVSINIDRSGAGCIHYIPRSVKCRFYKLLYAQSSARRLKKFIIIKVVWKTHPKAKKPHLPYGITCRHKMNAITKARKANF